jgi:hypothetical protein
MGHDTLALEYTGVGPSVERIASTLRLGFALGEEGRVVQELLSMLGCVFLNVEYPVGGV